MKRLTEINLLMLLSCLCLAGCSEKPIEPSSTEAPVPTTMVKAVMEDEAWHMEVLYWEYVQKIDTVAYKTLWHEDFIGYPGFGDGVSDIGRIASWIPDLHKNPDLTFSYTLYKKALNALEDVVIVFYDADEIWTNNQNQVVRKETYKITHTWKNVDGKWVILGGMAAIKNQSIL